MSAISWAVYLGCNTASRLAREWGISKRRAADRLSTGVRSGRLVIVRRGEYAARTGATACG